MATPVSDLAVLQTLCSLKRCNSAVWQLAQRQSRETTYYPRPERGCTPTSKTSNIQSTHFHQKCKEIFQPFKEAGFFCSPSYGCTVWLAGLVGFWAGFLPVTSIRSKTLKLGKESDCEICVYLYTSRKIIKSKRDRGIWNV